MKCTNCGKGDEDKEFFTVEWVTQMWLVKKGSRHLEKQRLESVHCGLCGETIQSSTKTPEGG